VGEWWRELFPLVHRKKYEQKITKIFEFEISKMFKKDQF
jgi:hypothetical protein